MTTDPLALVAAMPMPEPCTLVEVFEPGFRLPVEAEPASDYYTADQYRAARLEAAQLVLAQGEPVAWRPVETKPTGAYDGFIVKNALGQVAPQIRGVICNNPGGAGEWNYGEPITGWMPFPPADAAPAVPVNAEVLAALKDADALLERYRPPGYPVPDAQKRLRAAIASAEAAAKGVA